jgi:hypothetical protein
MIEFLAEEQSRKILVIIGGVGQDQFVRKAGFLLAAPLQGQGLAALPPNNGTVCVASAHHVSILTVPPPEPPKHLWAGGDKDFSRDRVREEQVLAGCLHLPWSHMSLLTGLAVTGLAVTGAVYLSEAGNRFGSKGGPGTWYLVPCPPPGPDQTLGSSRRP